MAKKENIQDLPLYRKVLLFSFFITFLVMASTAGFSFIYETNQLKDQLTDRATGVASLWSTTISSEDIQKALVLRDYNHPVVNRLNRIVTMVNERNSSFLEGYILEAKKSGSNVMTIVAASHHYEELGLGSFHTYNAGKKFLHGYKTAIDKKEVYTTSPYKDKYGLWITAFSPIINKDGQVVGVFCVDVDASIIELYKRKIAVYLFCAFMIVTIVVYFSLNWGIRKVLLPVNEIIEGINAVSAGNFNVKLQIHDHSEMTKLSDRFNLMTSQLSVLFEKLSDTYKEFGNFPAKLDNMHRFEEAIGEMEKIIAKTRIQKELQRAEKMNAIGQLAASVAHEIRNPMTVVKGFLQLFLAKDHLNAEELMYIKLMIEELNRAEIIINDYLSLAKPDFDSIEKVNAGELAQKVMDLMNSFAMLSKNIESMTFIKDNICIKGNESELKQVLINILKNGIEAMKTGGILTLAVRKSGGYGVFEIQDTGVGMTAEEVDRLGTAFYSLKEKGTGIGLMVCYQIVERMNGKIDVTSKKGKGTTFRIFIPQWDEEI